MSNLKTTPKQNAMILKLGRSDYAENPGDETWTFEVANTPAEKAVLGSLYRKGLAVGSGKFTSDDAKCNLTPAGVKFFYTLDAIEKAEKEATKPTVVPVATDSFTFKHSPSPQRLLF